MRWQWKKTISPYPCFLLMTSKKEKDSLTLFNAMEELQADKTKAGNKKISVYLEAFEQKEVSTSKKFSAEGVMNLKRRQGQ